MDHESLKDLLAVAAGSAFTGAVAIYFVLDKIVRETTSERRR
jgi:hypothetical protein